jgi:hypothetical protein
MKNNVTEKEIYANKFYNYYNDDNYTLYDIQEFYYPFYRIKCNCIFREKNKISIVEENFLEAIKCGIKDYESLENFLALDKEIFEEVAAKLHIDNLFIETPLLQLTEQGKKILEDGAKLSSVENEEYVTLDGITGNTSNEYIENEKKNDKSKNKNHLKVQIPYPKNETLDRIINNKALQTILFEEIKKKDKRDKEIYEIKEILGKPFKIYKKYFSLFFKNNENPKKTLIIKDGHPDDVMTNIINTIEQNGKNLFDFSKNIQEENKKLFEQKNIYEYSQIDNLTNGTQLSTYEHPKFFEYAFKYSKKEVLIISPWIRWEIIKEKKDAIENALKRKVEITFFYGMGKKDDLDKKSKQFFIDMQKNYPNLLKFSTNNDINDHSKIIICDRDWMVTTSFNWTSFKGDENREERKERGSFINDRIEVLKTIEVYMKI